MVGNREAAQKRENRTEDRGHYAAASRRAHRHSKLVRPQPLFPATRKAAPGRERPPAHASPQSKSIFWLSSATWPWNRPTSSCSRRTSTSLLEPSPKAESSTRAAA